MSKLVKRLGKKNCVVAGLVQQGSKYIYKDIIEVSISSPDYGRVRVFVDGKIPWYDSVPQPLRLDVCKVFVDFRDSCKWCQPVRGVDLEALRADLERLYQDLTAVYAGSKG